MIGEVHGRGSVGADEWDAEAGDADAGDVDGGDARESARRRMLHRSIPWMIAEIALDAERLNQWAVESWRAMKRVMGVRI